MIRTPLAFVLFAALAGCVIAPEEAQDERDKAKQAGDAYLQSRANRQVPELPQSPTWRDVLQRAFLVNGDLEAAYYEWVMAVERIDQAGTWPTKPVELGFDYMFSAERMKTFDHMTFSASLMDATPLPNKTYQDAKVAWLMAQSAGARFRQAKFELQARVLTAWADYALQAERVRVQSETVVLLTMLSDTAAARVRTGGPQQDLLRAQVEQRTAENELATMRAELRRQQASLNGLLMRATDALLIPPVAYPSPRPLTADDDALMALGVANNAELAVAATDRQAREAAVTRARLEYQPELNLTAAFTGSVSQAVGAMVTLPTRLPALRAMVAESRADLRRAEAIADQRRSDRLATFAATLVALRDAERRASVFDKDILPLATQSLALTRRGYTAGTSTYLDLIDAQRTLLDVRLMIADARAMRERMLAELEMLAGADVETLAETANATARSADKVKS